MLMADYSRKGAPTPTKRQTTPIHRQARIGFLALAFLALLLVAPVTALTRVATWVDWRILMAMPVTLSLLTFFAYRHDKRRAEVNDWRISEQTLHFLEMLGGWPGAFLAQRRFRHKTAKTSYQVTFWTIVAIHQLVALDALTAWRFARLLLKQISV